MHELRTVTTYRDRYNIDTRTALGDTPRTNAHKHDKAQAARAIRRARTIAADEEQGQALRFLSLTSDGAVIE